MNGRVFQQIVDHLPDPVGIGVDLRLGRQDKRQVFAGLAFLQGRSRVGQQLAEKIGLANLEFRIGDIEEPPIEGNSLDLAVLSQALHHAARPQRAIDAAFRILKPGGRLIVLDLLLHTFEEARELYADRWLGFSECELATMLERAGFTHIETVVADRETSAPGFQTLLGIDVRPA